MKKITIALAALMLAGCGKPPDQWQSSTPVTLTNIKGFEDCYASLINTGSYHLYAIRCPNSTVNTTTSGKTPARTITVDGVEYVEKH